MRSRASGHQPREYNAHGRRLAAVLVAWAMVLAPSVRADAYAFVVSGTVYTHGTWNVVAPDCGSTPCPATNTWNLFAATGSGVHGAAARSVFISGDGTFHGWCDNSHGVGAVNVSEFGTGSVTWGGFGGVLVVTGSAGGHAINAVVVVRPVPTGGDCVTTAAKQFALAGVLVGN